MDLSKCKTCIGESHLEMETFGKGPKNVRRTHEVRTATIAPRAKALHVSLVSFKKKAKHVVRKMMLICLDKSFRWQGGSRPELLPWPNRLSAFCEQAFFLKPDAPYPMSIGGCRHQVHSSGELQRLLRKDGRSRGFSKCPFFLGSL